MNLSRLGVVLVILGALLLGTDIVSADQDVAVELTEFKFVPAALNVKAGEKVRFLLIQYRSSSRMICISKGRDT